MSDDIKEIKQDVKEIKQIVTELQKSDAVQSHVINEHHKRSTQLEEALKPIQLHVSIVQKILYAAGAILLAVVTQYLIGRLLP